MNPLNEIVTLVTEIPGEHDEDGFSGSIPGRELEVFAAFESAKRNEYYEALRTGHNVSCTVTVGVDDYNEASLIHEGKRYRPGKAVYEDTVFRIFRTYRKGMQYMELILEEVE